MACDILLLSSAAGPDDAQLLIKLAAALPQCDGSNLLQIHKCNRKGPEGHVTTPYLPVGGLIYTQTAHWLFRHRLIHPASPSTLKSWRWTCGATGLDSWNWTFFFFCTWEEKAAATQLKDQKNNKKKTAQHQKTGQTNSLHVSSWCLSYLLAFRGRLVLIQQESIQSLALNFCLCNSAVLRWLVTLMRGSSKQTRCNVKTPGGWSWAQYLLLWKMSRTFYVIIFTLLHENDDIFMWIFCIFTRLFSHFTLWDSFTFLMIISTFLRESCMFLHVVTLNITRQARHFFSRLPNCTGMCPVELLLLRYGPKCGFVTVKIHSSYSATYACFI